MEVFPLEGRAVIVPRAAGIYYTGWSSAPQGTGASSVTLSTDQSKVSYVDQTGVCHSNNGPTCTIASTCASCTTCNACNGLSSGSSPCAATGAFCGPVQMISNYSFALPDVVLQVANHSGETRNAILSCSDSASYGGGQCEQDASNAQKVTGSTTSLTEPISGCSYCYGNRALLGSANLGLRDAVMPGSGSASINTDKLVMNLMGDSNFGLDILVNFPAVSIASVAIDDDGITAVCATPGATNVTVTGDAFGPPGDCTGAPSTCSASGNAGTGYTLDFLRTQGMNTTQVSAIGPATWSDQSVNATFGNAQQGGTGQARIITPRSATGITSSSFTICGQGGALDHFDIKVFGSPMANGTFTFSVVARDRMGGRVTNETGTITLELTRSGTDDGSFTFVTPNANPASYTWVASDKGGNRFTNGARAGAAGSYTLTVTQGMISSSTTFTVN